jgi:hypothetical protein
MSVTPQCSPEVFSHHVCPQNLVAEFLVNFYPSHLLRSASLCHQHTESDSYLSRLPILRVTGALGKISGCNMVVTGAAYFVTGAALKKGP